MRGKSKVCSRRCAAMLPRKYRDQGGAKNPNWKGGRTKHAKGYVYAYAPRHPRQHNGYVLEHILVAEQKIGRYLKPEEIVHHEDEVKDNNDPGNIKVLTRGEHTRYHNRRRFVV